MRFCIFLLSPGSFTALQSSSMPIECVELESVFDMTSRRLLTDALSLHSRCFFSRSWVGAYIKSILHELGEVDVVARVVLQKLVSARK